MTPRSISKVGEPPTFPKLTAKNKISNQIIVWLFVCCAMIVVMAIIGALTRLTESGLSIMEWAPLGGTFPPVSAQEWERLFLLYQQTGEYRYENTGMSLAQFKSIFWWEYIHRLWGRLIGLVFLLPFIWFLWRGMLSKKLILPLLGAFALGGMQGGIGWFMVASGFSTLTDVSHYRLALHLGMALIVYAWLLWIALQLFLPANNLSLARKPYLGGQLKRFQQFSMAFLGLVALMIISGALVAGLDAGKVYNTFPFMNGEVIPQGYASLSPWGWNLTDNRATVQFNHRVLAFAIFLYALILVIFAYAKKLPKIVRRASFFLFGAVVLQASLGVATLLALTPVWLGVLHQLGAITVLSLVIFVVVATSKMRKLP